MSDTIFFKELSDLPEELKTWGKQALSKIESPEKKHEAAKSLRQNIDNLWDECSLENPEEKIKYVLSKLGCAELAAEEMKNSYTLRQNSKVDKIVGIISLILATVCSVYPFMVFFVFSRENPSNASIYTTYLTGKGAGAGWVCAIVLFVFGMWLLIHSRKKG